MTGTRWLVLFCITLAASAQARIPTHVPTRFDSAHALGLDAQVTGTVLSDKRTTGGYQEDIIAQLYYLVGPLNAYSSAVDLGHAKIKITSVSDPGGSGFQQVQYTASLILGWGQPSSAPASLSVPVPSLVTEDGKALFFKKFAPQCAQEGSESDLTPISFYYYYRPDQTGCPLFYDTDPSALVSRATLVLKPSTAVTQGKSPEYEKVWEDRQLVATIIVGSYAEGATSDQDAGIASYNALYRAFRKTFGKPTWSSVHIGALDAPHHRRPDVEMTFDLGSGFGLNVNLLLVDKKGLQTPTLAFQRRYLERSRFSDFISYNGHSGFGENIRALAGMGDFQKGQYQLFYVNGCDTFTYVDDALRLAHQQANPSGTPYQFFDIITNAMPSAFNDFVQTNFALLNAFLEQAGTYREIFTHFNPNQSAIVIGEEDNHWPKPFPK